VSQERGPVWAILLYILGGFVPSGVALALTAIKEGRAGMRAIWKRMRQVNIGWRWYLAAVGVVLLTTAGQITINRLLGHGFDISLFVAQLGSLVPLLFLGPLSEEIGWRGYALDRLQARWNPLVSSLFLGLVWALWHGPLFAMPGTSQHELAMPFIGFILSLMAVSIVYTGLHTHTGGSIWMAIFFHWIGTYGMQVVSTGITRSPGYNRLEYLPVIVIAVVLVVWWKPWKKRSQEG
jgi:membrane protease YdiL (CAAX protease family)